MNIRNFLLTIVIVACSLLSVAQKPLYTQAKINDIEKLARQLGARQASQQEAIAQLAKQLKIDVERVLSGGRVIRLKGVNEIGEPVFTITESNLQAGQTTRTNSLYSGGSLGVSLTGAAEAINGRLGIWDGGKVLNTHTEFGNRVSQIDNAGGISQHSTHVAGTMVAAGLSAAARGMAPGAQLKAWDFSNDDSEMANASKDLLVSNHSYGQIAGWVFNENRGGNQKWEWYGNTSISEFEDYKFGLYDSQSQSWDRIAYNAPNYLIVKSVGNKRNENGPGLNAAKTLTSEAYFLGSGNDTSRVVRSRNDGYDIIPTYGVAKNILTVGAVNSYSAGPNFSSEIKIASFSSWGPTDDGRIKPDIVGVGVNLFSTASANNTAYAILGGTSMSSPQVAGSLFMLQDLYAKLYNGKLMRSSSLKALALHTAIDAGNPGPDYIYGWGLLNTEKAGMVLQNKNQEHFLAELSLPQGDSYTKKVVANGKEPLRVTICWTDPEAEPSAITAANLNSRFPKLINDLDVQVSDGQNNYQAWILDPNKPDLPATQGNNTLDNVEQVYIANAVPGKEYTITINHKSALKFNNQDFALVVSGIGGPSYCNAIPNSELDSRIEAVKLANLNYTASNTCKKYTDISDKTISIKPGQNVDFELLAGTCAGQFAKQLTLFADWNLDGDFDDENEKLFKSTLQNENIFTGKIKVPATQKVGQNVRLRALLSEEENSAACGAYTKGETLDMAMQVIYPKVDLQLFDMTFPSQSLCAGDVIEHLAVSLKNLGSSSLKINSIAYNIFENNQLIIEKIKRIDKDLAALSTLNLTLEQNLNLLPNKTYRFEWQANTNDDENLENNNFVSTRSIVNTNDTITARVLNCSNSNSLSLVSDLKDGATFWYDKEQDGNLLAVGNNVTISKPAPNTNIYVSANNINGIIGPKTKSEFGGGTYSGNFGPKPIIKTKAPIRLESARLYIGHSGRITFTVERVSDLMPISQVTLDVSATRNPAIGLANNGQQLDDPNDPGAIYNLGLDIPQAGEYQISIEYEDEASIFRSNVGVSGFPYSLQSAVDVTGSSFQGGTLTAAWYYFYNLKIRSLACPIAVRTLALPGTGTSVSAAITSNKTNLCPNESAVLSAGTGSNFQYQWYKDGQAIANARSSSFNTSQKGSYYVEISSGGQCPALSNAITLSTKTPQAPAISAVGNVLTASEAESYQWLLRNTLIPGATQKTYAAVETGNYAVRAKVDGCSIDSFDLYISILADETTRSTHFRVFPNPATNALYVEGVSGNGANYKIFDMGGRTIQNAQINEKQGVDVSALPPGKYAIQIVDKQKIHTAKFIKQ